MEFVCLASDLDCAAVTSGERSCPVVWNGAVVAGGGGGFSGNGGGGGVTDVWGVVAKLAAEPGGYICDGDGGGTSA